jgi:hypothetical protein
MDGPGNRVKVCLYPLLLNPEELEYCQDPGGLGPKQPSRVDPGGWTVEGGCGGVESTPEEDKDRSDD